MAGEFFSSENTDFRDMRGEPAPEESCSLELSANSSRGRAPGVAVAQAFVSIVCYVRAHAIAKSSQ